MKIADWSRIAERSGMMKVTVLFFAMLFLHVAADTASAQTILKSSAAATQTSADVRASAAYAELLLKRTELQADLEVMAVEYTEEYPKVAEGRYAFELIEKERARLLAVKPAEISKLTQALGKLIVRKIELEVDLWTLRKTLQDGHPDVKRAKRKVEIFEAAIKEILG